MMFGIDSIVKLDRKEASALVARLAGQALSAKEIVGEEWFSSGTDCWEN